ncbi:MAG TPA: CpsB/CapC family capsule biosynthesis tyrosine phosphatase [Solirubrobacteraceae bacterium]|nr:CpsB/CapC family capsule biosynthesis tyrosine phosphatase [Solirubrobacteraceae bacterium]
MPAVDLHCHLLPGVDDGPQRLEESIEYARDAAASGTGTIVATPHVEMVDVRTLPARVEIVRSALAEEGIDLRVEVGGELKPQSIGSLRQDELEIIAQGPPGARWLLYEVPFRGIDEAFVAGARELRRRGFGLLLAHPERSRGFLDGGLDRLDPLIASGAMIAANVGPLSGREGDERWRAAKLLLDRGAIDVVATDAHPPRRPYQLPDVQGMTRDDHDRLTAQTTAALLRDGLERR